jgi:hypothetical protein
MTELIPPCATALDALPPDQDGWVRRTVTDPTKAEELVEIYRGYGFETRIVAAGADCFTDSCRACLLSAGGCVTLFTRPARPPATGHSPAIGAR